MSTTIARRPHAHIHVPWTAIAVLMAAAALAAVAVVLLEQPWDAGRDSQTATTGTQAVTAEQAVAVPRPLSQAELRAYAAAAAAADGAADAAPATRLNPVEGVSLDAPSTYVLQPPAPYYPPGAPGVDNPRPLNFFAGEPR
jgi:hypothetical protein